MIMRLQKIQKKLRNHYLNISTHHFTYQGITLITIGTRQKYKMGKDHVNSACKPNQVRNPLKKVCHYDWLKLFFS